MSTFNDSTNMPTLKPFFIGQKIVSEIWNLGARNWGFIHGKKIFADAFFFIKPRQCKQQAILERTLACA